VSAISIFYVPSSGKRTFAVWQVVGGCSVLIITALLYWRTLCPTVYWEDSGELIAAARALGIAHSPGHPLYVLLGRLLSLLPWGSVAFRVNMLSMVSATVGALLVYGAGLVLLSLMDRREALSGVGYSPFVAAGAGSLLLVASRTYWSQAVVAEVYALLGFFVALLLLLALIWEWTHDTRAVILMGIVGGLSLTNHPSVIALLPAFVWSVWLRGRRVLSSSVVAVSVLMVVVGLTLYLYLLIRSRVGPLVDWGHPATWRSFFHVLTAREFRSEFVAGLLAAEHGPLLGAGRFVTGLPHEFTWPGLLAILVGVGAAFCRRPGLATLLVLVVSFNVLFAVLVGGGPDYDAYFIPALVSLSLLAVAGFWTVLTILPSRVRWVGALGTVVIVAFAIIQHYPYSDRSRTTCAREYGLALMEGMLPHALFLTRNTVDLFLSHYLQAIEGTRPDVVCAYIPLLREDWYRDDVAERGVVLPEDRAPVSLARANCVNRPVYASSEVGLALPGEAITPEGVRFKWNGGFDIEYHWTVSRAQTGGACMDERSLVHYTIMHSNFGEHFLRVRELDASYEEYRLAAEVDSTNGRAAFNLGRALDRLGRWSEAVDAYQRACRLGFVEPVVWHNLGAALLQIGRIHEAEEAFLEAIHRGGTDQQIRYNLAICYLRQGRIHEAVEENLHVLAVEPYHPEAHNNLGLCYVQQGLLEKAAAEFRLSVDLKEDYREARSNLARVWCALGMVDSARWVLQEGLRERSGDPTMLYELARVEAVCGKAQVALDHLRRAVTSGGLAVKRMVASDPAFGPLRSLPEYKKLMASSQRE
jgi:Flp pilus assembly protein TadD